jgi:hypothetical protein
VVSPTEAAAIAAASTHAFPEDALGLTVPTCQHQTATSTTSNADKESGDDRGGQAMSAPERRISFRRCIEVGETEQEVTSRENINMRNIKGAVYFRCFRNIVESLAISWS